MSIDCAAPIAANRFGLGAVPGQLAQIGADPRGWLSSQLRGPPPLLGGAQLRPTADVLRDAAAARKQLQALRRNSPDSTTSAAGAVGSLMRVGALLRQSYVADVTARLQSGASSERPFLERLVYFWSNHFAVSVDKLAVLGVAGSFEREAIRPHVLGHFSELLLAVEQHPAMLLYLDNQRSAGPNSPAAQRAANHDRTLGLNENLAREIMELHTLGVDAGYTQADVSSFAKVLTGWSLGGGEGPLSRGNAGEFLFRAPLHEPGAQSVFHQRYEQSDEAQGRAVLIDLAQARSTARHLATKLARHFIADEPPPAAVEHIAQAFEHSGGHLPTVYQALIQCDEAWSAPFSKFKTPQDYVLSTYRGLQLAVADTPHPLAAFEVLGQRQFAPGSPAGWPDRGDDWNGASALMKRIELADAVAQKIGGTREIAALAPQLLGNGLSDATRQSIARAASPPQALTLLLTAPEFMRR